MKIELDTLKCVKELLRKGVGLHEAEALVELLTDSEIKNLYNRLEIDQVISQSFRDTITECRSEFDKRLEVLYKQIDVQTTSAEKRAELAENRSEEGVSELRDELKCLRTELRTEFRSGHRWVLATIISCTLTLAGLLHLTH